MKTGKKNIIINFFGVQFRGFIWTPWAPSGAAHKGETMATMCRRVQGILQVSEMKALAMEVGLVFANQIEFYQEIMEGDYNIVYNAAMANVCWKLKEYTKKKQNDLVSKQKNW